MAMLFHNIHVKMQNLEIHNGGCNHAVCFYIKAFGKWIGNKSFENVFFSIWVLFHRHWRFKGLQGKARIVFIPLYHFYLLKNIQTFISKFVIQMTPAYF